MSRSHFKIPLDLPHAGTIAMRIAHVLSPYIEWPQQPYFRLAEIARELQELLLPYRSLGENPPAPEAEDARARAARLARDLVDEVERLKLTGDRLGQHVRNLFECLELGEEGAAISLRAGEDPRSPQRP